MTPQQSTQLQYGGIALVALGIGYYFLFYNPDKNGGSANDPTGNGTVSNPGTNNFSAKNIADTLLEAMASTGTDEDAIISILKNVNQDQFGFVVKAFQFVQYNSVMGNQINYNPFSQLPYKNLPFWLKSELSTKEYGILRLKYPKYL
jgi:hypothetical protein